MYSFRNIDSFVPLYYERQGMLKNKLWFEDRGNLDKETGRNVRGLFKPRRKEFKHPMTVFCGNHYGELVGSILARRSKMSVCDAELVQVNTEKNRYTKGVIVQKDGCIVYSRLRKLETLIPGKVIIDRFRTTSPEEFQRLSGESKAINRDAENNNIEIILAAIENTLRNEGATEQEIANEKKYMIQMVVYDCAFGNNDRHDENWSMTKDLETHEVRVYPAYDNERVLGLYENENLIKDAIRTDSVVSVSNKVLTSRIGIPGKPEGIEYSIVLEYLAEHYPEQTLEAMKDIIDNVSSKDIIEILSECEGLPAEYVEFGTLMFAERRKTLERLVSKIEEKKIKGQVEDEFSL